MHVSHFRHAMKQCSIEHVNSSDYENLSSINEVTHVNSSDYENLSSINEVSLVCVFSHWTSTKNSLINDITIVDNEVRSRFCKNNSGGETTNTRLSMYLYKLEFESSLGLVL